MSDKLIDDMALEDEEKVEPLPEMSLDSPSAVEIGIRLAKAFPGEDVIKFDEKTSLLKMASGGYRFGDCNLKDCTVDDLNKIDEFLKKKE